MSGEQIKTMVKAFILKEFLPGESPENLADETELLDSGILDSLATLEVVMFLEEEFDLNLERADLDALATPGSITDLILRKQQNG